MPDKQLNIRLTEEEHRQFKKWCAAQGVSMTEPLRDFVEWIVRTQLDANAIRLILADIETDLDPDFVAAQAQGQGEG